MKRDQPTAPDEWLDEIRLAIVEARETKPFGLLTGQRITDTNLFHLAPLVYMKFRGLDSGNEVLARKLQKGHWKIMSPTPILMGLTTDWSRGRCWRSPCVTLRHITSLI